MGFQRMIYDLCIGENLVLLDSVGRIYRSSSLGMNHSAAFTSKDTERVLILMSSM
jgi:hypothetical protein